MKKTLLFVLTLAMILSLCACGGDSNKDNSSSNQTTDTLEIGEVATTDIVEFSITRFEYAEKLKNATFATGKTPDPEYLLPTEEVQSNNPFEADEGKVMISFSYTLKNTGKEELNFPVDLGIVADYNDGYKFEASVDVIKGEYVVLKDTTSLAPLSDACEGRGYIEVPLEVMENNVATLYLVISLPLDCNSEETSEVIYKIR